MNLFIVSRKCIINYTNCNDWTNSIPLISTKCCKNLFHSYTTEHEHRDLKDDLGEWFDSYSVLKGMIMKSIHNTLQYEKIYKIMTETK